METYPSRSVLMGELLEYFSGCARQRATGEHPGKGRRRLIPAYYATSKQARKRLRLAGPALGGSWLCASEGFRLCGRFDRAAVTSRRRQGCEAARKVQAELISV